MFGFRVFLCVVCVIFFHMEELSTSMFFVVFFRYFDVFCVLFRANVVVKFNGNRMKFSISFTFL